MQPLLLRPQYWQEIEATIQRIFNEAIFIPLQRALTDNQYGQYQNAKNTALYDALVSGRLTVLDGVVLGKLTATLSRELLALGAVKDRKTGNYRFTGTQPPIISTATALSKSRYDAQRHSVLEALNTRQVDEAIKKADLYGQYQKTLGLMERDFRAAAKGIEIPPQFTPAMTDAIAKQWATNLEMYIKDWAASDILELRGKVQANTFSGQRAGGLVKMIEANYEVSRNKAKFLARQETSLLTSKYREQRYGSMGITRYRWRGSMDSRERDSHRALEGKVFDFSNPPNVAAQGEPARYCNPGEDFNCRCVAVPVLEDEE